MQQCCVIYINKHVGLNDIFTYSVKQKLPESCYEYTSFHAIYRVTLCDSAKAIRHTEVTGMLWIRTKLLQGEQHGVYRWLVWSHARDKFQAVFGGKTEVHFSPICLNDPAVRQEWPRSRSERCNITTYKFGRESTFSSPWLNGLEHRMNKTAAAHVEKDPTWPLWEQNNQRNAKWCTGRKSYKERQA